LETSFGMDLYEEIFGAQQGKPRQDVGGPARSDMRQETP
jgi:hypothetical protein